MDSLLERESVLAELDRRLHQAECGDGQLVLLRGEAGIGKTAVIAQFLSAQGAGVRVLRGWCDPLATPRPLGPLSDMVAQSDKTATAGLAAALADGEPEAIFARLLTLLGGDGLWVCVIEDAHWADGATLDLLRFLARRVGSLPVLLVVTYRDDELNPQHPLAVALGDVATCAAVSRISLAPLSADAIAVLAAGSGVNANELYRLTGGNAFFVTEVLAVGPAALNGTSLPRSVSEAVLGRLGRLSQATRDTAHAVAVCGPRVSLELLEGVCPGAGDAVSECLGAGVLVGDATTVEFRHELARRAVLETIPKHLRRALHAKVLATLAEAEVAPKDLGALAFHADQAGDGDAVIRYGVPAAQRAAALRANRQAADLYELVLRRAGSSPPSAKAEWLEKHAFSTYLAGALDASAESWRAAIALRHELGDRVNEADNHRWLSHTLWPLGRTIEATESARASLGLLEQVGPCPQLAWSLVNLAQLAVFGFDPRGADYAVRALALGEQLGDHGVVFRARSYCLMAAGSRADTGWDELEDDWRNAMVADDLVEHAGLVGTVMCNSAVLHHDLARAQRYIGETATFCADNDLGLFAALVAGVKCLADLYRGQWACALSAADDVLTRALQNPLTRIMPLLTIALVRARRGEQPVDELLDEALAAAEPDNLFRSGAVWAARAETAWLRGDNDTAARYAQTGLAAATSPHTDPWLVGHLQRWLHLAEGTPIQTAAADEVTPYRLEIRGDWRAAAAEWIRRDCPYDAALAQLGGDAAAVESAFATFRRLGAAAAARRAQQRLQQLRGGARRGLASDTQSDPHRLTRRQRDVLTLLAAGRSDADIAAALCITPKTASHHVSAILAKLQVTNRTQAVAAYNRNNQAQQ